LFDLILLEIVWQFDEFEDKVILFTLKFGLDRCRVWMITPSFITRFRSITPIVCALLMIAWSSSTENGHQSIMG
jgi:hypothetical protein